ACAFLTVWIIGALWVRREYIHSFRSALETKAIQPEALHVDTLDNQTIGTLVGVLSSTDERQVLYALDLLSGVDPSRWQSQLNGLIRHPSSAVRGRAAAVLAQWNDPVTTKLISELLYDSDISVRAEAIRALGLKSTTPQYLEMLDGLLEDPRIEVAK